MSAADFVLFYETIVDVLNGFWNVLQQLTIAGLGLGTWFIGFFIFAVLIRIFWKVTANSGDVVGKGSAVASKIHRRSSDE